MEKWYKCPFCKQKIFPYDDQNANVNGIKIKCKGRNCGKIIDVKIENGIVKN